MSFEKNDKEVLSQIPLSIEPKKQALCIDDKYRSKAMQKCLLLNYWR
jgi:hypothetical protein